MIAENIPTKWTRVNFHWKSLAFIVNKKKEKGDIVQCLLFMNSVK